MASRDSVTVSMAAERIGMFIVIPRHTRVRRSTSFGWVADRPGTIETSSKVKARRGSRSDMRGLVPLRKRRPKGRPDSIPRRRASSHRHRRAVTLLVLLARAARAGIVAAHFGLPVNRRLGPLSLDLGRRGELDLGRRPLLADSLLDHLLLGHRLVAEELLDDVVLDPLAHHLEEVEAL